MRSHDLTIVAVFFALCATVTAAPPEPVFEDDTPEFADEELREAFRVPRPIFADEPFFEEDVYPEEIPDPILPVECLRDSVEAEHELRPWWHIFGPLKTIRDQHTDTPNDWPWPDRGRAWTARLSAVRWSRSQSDGGVLFSNPAVAGQSVSASNFDVSHDGADFSIILHDFWPNGIQEEYDLEARFVYLLQSSANQTAMFTGPTTRLHAFPVINEPTRLNLSTSLTSDFYTGELNVRHEAENGWWTSLWGVRYISLEDNLNASFSDPVSGAGYSQYQAHTANRMFGPQVGGNMAFLRTQRFCVDAHAKVGACWNSIDSVSSYDGTNAFDVSESKNQASFLGEIGIEGRYAFGRQWTFLLGYQALMLYRVADGSSQLGRTNFATQQGYSSGDSVIYHAGAVGFEYRY